MSETRNVEWQVTGNDLFIRIDLSQRLGPSSSGKTVVVATTSGNIETLDGSYRVREVSASWASCLRC